MLIIDDQNKQDGTTENKASVAQMTHEPAITDSQTSPAGEIDPDTFYYYLQDGRPKVNVGRTVNKDILIKSIVDVYNTLQSDVAKGEFLALVCTAHRLPTSIINSSSVEECATLAADAAEKILTPVDVDTDVEISPETGAISADVANSDDSMANPSGFGDDVSIDAEDEVNNLN